MSNRGTWRSWSYGDEGGTVMRVAAFLLFTQRGLSHEGRQHGQPMQDHMGRREIIRSHSQCHLDSK